MDCVIVDSAHDEDARVRALAYTNRGSSWCNIIQDHLPLVTFMRSCSIRNSDVDDSVKMGILQVQACEGIQEVSSDRNGVFPESPLYCLYKEHIQRQRIPLVVSFDPHIRIISGMRCRWSRSGTMRRLMEILPS
jgi:hypothetical protein